MTGILIGRGSCKITFKDKRFLINPDKNMHVFCRNEFPDNQLYQLYLLQARLNFVGARHKKIIIILINKCSDWSMELKLLGNYDRPTSE